MKKCFRALVIIVLAVLALGRLYFVLEADYDGNQSAKGFYRLDKNTADILFYGSSHIYAGVDTAKLWDDYGIAGYDFAGTMQTLWNSYYNMAETLKYQTPKVMAVDLYGALIEEEYYTSSNVIKNVSSMRFSVNKIRNVWNSVPHEKFLSYLFSYPLTHDSYRELQKGNYKKLSEPVGGKWYKGYHPSFVCTSFDSLPVVRQADAKRPPSEKNRKYLEKMVELAQKRGIQLVFMVTPYMGVTDEDEEVYAWIEQFARERDVLFLDANRCLAEMGFEPSADYAEESHLNHSGAGKFSAYLGQWLRERTGLADHRGEAAYDSWQRYSDCWAYYRQDNDLSATWQLEDYIKKLKECDAYTIWIAFDDHFRENTPALLLGQLWQGQPAGQQYDNILVVEKGKILYQSPDVSEFLWYVETDSLDIAACRNYGEDMKIIVNNVVQNDNSNDVTIVVYDSRLDRIADVAAFNRDGVMLR